MVFSSLAAPVPGRGDGDVSRGHGREITPTGGGAGRNAAGAGERLGGGGRSPGKALQERERQLHVMVAEQIEAIEELKKLKSLEDEAEMKVATFEADLIQEKVTNRLLNLEATSRDTQLGFVVGGFERKQLMVSRVLHGSWAEQKGLTEGDELTSIDGKDVKDFREPELLECLQSQRPLKLTFLKPEKHPPPPSWPAEEGWKTDLKTGPAPSPAKAEEQGAEHEFWQPTEKQARYRKMFLFLA